MRALETDTLRAVASDETDYTPLAREVAQAEIERRRHDPTWDESRPPVRCGHCGHEGRAEVRRLFVPSDDPDGVTDFEAHSCEACGRTELYRLGD